MRKKTVAGNWKMNTTVSEGLNLTKEIKQKTETINTSETEIIIIPPFVHLIKIKENLGDKIKLGAQNCSAKEKGAFTGEISVKMLKDINIDYCLVGHSERRQYHNETNELLKQKINLLLSENITPIYCCGEKLNQRQENKHFEIIKEQITQSLFHLDIQDIKKIIIAYEPVWAIGTGKTASPEQAQEIHNYIRTLLSDKYNNKTAADITILYGGSCNPANAKKIFSMPDIDGGLIGGASLKSNDFIEIIKSF